MPKLGSPAGLNDYSATLRQLKLLVVVLVLSNIGLGLFSMYLLRSTDARYSEVLGKSVPVLSDLRTLTAELANEMRSTGLPLIRATESQRTAAIERAQAAIARGREFRTRVLSDVLPLGMEDSRAGIRTEGDMFDSLSEQIVGFVAAGHVDRAVTLRDEQLSPSFEAYLGAINKTAEAIQSASQKANDDLTIRTGTLSRLVLGIAGWPIIVLLALLLLTAIFVLVLMVLFRGREIGDMP